MKEKWSLQPNTPIWIHGWVNFAILGFLSLVPCEGHTWYFSLFMQKDGLVLRSFLVPRKKSLASSNGTQLNLNTKAESDDEYSAEVSCPLEVPQFICPLVCHFIHNRNSDVFSSFPTHPPVVSSSRPNKWLKDKVFVTPLLFRIGSNIGWMPHSRKEAELIIEATL